MSAKTYSEEAGPPVTTDTPTEDPHTGVICRESRIVHRSIALLSAGEAAIHRWLMRYSIIALRISMGMVYFTFGILKYFPGVSPAQDLALTTTHLLSFGLIPAVIPDGVAMALIATLECAIGLLLITGRWLRLTIGMLTIQLAGILSPVMLLAGRLFAGPHNMPTLEGQYVLKDVILVAAAMVIATTVRGGVITDGRGPRAQHG